MYKKGLVSVIIPSYKDPYLHPTIDSLLYNAQGEVEIVVVLDGYLTDKPFRDDKRIKVVHLGANRGMRGAINAGVAVANGEFIMRTDEHCMFGPGYDVILKGDLKENEIVNPRRYFLDPEKWEIMDIPYIDYGDLKIQGTGSGRKFHGQDNQDIKEERKDILVDETFAIQGSCWMMKHEWWDKVIGELQIEGYGPLYQDSHEMVFKTWRAGGRLTVNKKTWHAHKHRSFNRTHSNGTKENPSNNEKCFAYSLSVWEPYYLELKKNGRLDHHNLDK